MRSLPRLMAAVTLTAAAVLIPTTAHAATYPPAPGATITLGQTTARVGDTVTFEVAGAKADSDVSFSASNAATFALGATSIGGGRVATAVRAATASCGDQATCTATADSSGALSASVKVTAAGTTTITVSGTDAADAAFSETATISVEPALVGDPGPGETGSDLPKTGGDSVGRNVLYGISLVLLGAIVVLIARRRRAV